MDWLVSESNKDDNAQFARQLKAVCKRDTHVGMGVRMGVADQGTACRGDLENLETLLYLSERLSFSSLQPDPNPDRCCPPGPG